MRATQAEALEVLVLGEPTMAGSHDGVSPAYPIPKVTFAANRQSALAVLRRQGKHIASSRPAVVLLDVGRHGEQGWTLLREIKGDPQLKRIPVIVLGASNPITEKARAYDRRANSYLPPLNREAQLDNLLEQIQAFWLTKVRLPPG